MIRPAMLFGLTLGLLSAKLHGAVPWYSVVLGAVVTALFLAFDREERP